MQTLLFDTGGFVLHRYPAGAARRASAWFDASGALVAAEVYDRLGRARPIKPNGPTWARLQLAGVAAAARIREGLPV